MTQRADVRYALRHCPFLRQDVWAIVTKQANGTWRIVNCLDKDKPCYQENCAFTTDGGEWPFKDRQMAVPEPPNGSG